MDPYGLDEPAQPVPELVELFKRHRVKPEADPLAAAHVRIRELEDRVLADIDARGDAEDLRRENAELRAQLADVPTSEAVVATLREWSTSANPAYEYGPGTTQIAMSVAMARKILEEIDGLTGDRDQMRETLWRMTDDEPCDYDHHGYCQAHRLSEMPCSTAEARRLIGDWEPEREEQ